MAKLSDATGDLADHIRAYRTDVERQAMRESEVQRQQQAIIGTDDTLRGDASSVLTGGFSSMAHGQGFGKGTSSALSSFGESLMGKGVDTLNGGFIGNKGQAGGGTFGGALSSLISGLPHFAGGTIGAPGGPTIVDESGPEIVMMPKNAEVATAGQTSGSLGAQRAAPTINMGDSHVHVAGDVSEKNMAAINQAVAAGQQHTLEHVTRNLSQIQWDAGQAG